MTQTVNFSRPIQLADGGEAALFPSPLWRDTHFPHLCMVHFAVHSPKGLIRPAQLHAFNDIGLPAPWSTDQIEDGDHLITELVPVVNVPEVLPAELKQVIDISSWVPFETTIPMEGGGEATYYRSSHSTGRITGLIQSTQGHTGGFEPVTWDGVTGALVTKHGNGRAIDMRKVTMRMVAG